MVGKKWTLLGHGHCLNNLWWAVSAHIELVICWRKRKMWRGQGKCLDFHTSASSCPDLFMGCLDLPVSPILPKMHPKKHRPAQFKHEIHTFGSCFAVLGSESQIYFFAEWSWGLTPTTPQAQLLHWSVECDMSQGPRWCPSIMAGV